MKKTGKVIMALLCLAAILCFAAGCGNAEPAEPAPAEPAPATEAPAEPAAPAEAEEEPAESDFSVGGYTAENPLELTMATFGVGESNPHCQTATMYAEKVLEASKGAIVIDVYNDAILASTDREIMESLVLNTIDVACNNTAIFSNYVDDYLVLDLEYMISDWEHAHAFLGSDVCKTLLDKLTPSGVRLLSLEALGFRNMNLIDKPVHSVEDMKGVTVRVIESKLYIDSFNAYGAAPQAMSATEATTALQQHTIDGQDMTNMVIYATGTIDFCPYVSESQHVMQFYGITFSEKKWQTLPEDVQALLSDVAIQTGVEHSRAMEEYEQEFKDQLIELGAIFNEDVDKESFKNCLTDVYQEYFDTYGSETYDAIVALGK